MKREWTDYQQPLTYFNCWISWPFTGAEGAAGIDVDMWDDVSLLNKKEIKNIYQKKKQLDWLMTNTDDITSRSHSLFAQCSRTNLPSGKPA